MIFAKTITRQLETHVEARPGWPLLIPSGINMKVHSTGAPPYFSRFSGPKNAEERIFLAPMTIVEIFAKHVPRRMQLLSSGDGLEGRF